MNVKRKQLEGRDHLVVPVVMLTAGTYTGSSGPVTYMADDLRNSVPLWNGKPVVVNHPANNGSLVGAADPDFVNGFKIGTIYNTRFDGARLVAEAWIDVERTMRIEPRVLETLAAGRPMEVSTGVYIDFRHDPFIGVSQIAMNYRPDHLAVLPDITGACGIRDGCGLLMNSRSEEALVIPGTHDD